MSTERLMTPYISQTKEGQCLAVERFSNNHQLSKLCVPFSYYCPGGSYKDNRADDVVLFTGNFSPSHFPSLSLWVHTIGGVSAGGILLFQAECTCYSKHPLSCFTLGWADRHKSLYRCDGAKQERGSEGHGCFFYCSPWWWEVLQQNKGKSEYLFLNRAARSDVKFKG